MGSVFGRQKAEQEMCACTPVTASVVVVVVAPQVSLPLGLAACGLDFRHACVAFRFVVTVFASALFTEFELLDAAAVTSIPITS